MHDRLSIRQRVICAVIALFVSGGYLGFYFYILGATWQRKEGDLTRVSTPVENVGLFLASFPFGFVPGLSSILTAPILNVLLWSTIAVLLYVRFFRRAVT